MPRILPEEPTATQATGVLFGTISFFLFGLWALAGIPLSGVTVRTSAASDAMVIWLSNHFK
jgi:hypothetical protein